MSRLDQRHQVVDTQYNIAGEVNVDGKAGIRGRMGVVIRAILVLVYLFSCLGVTLLGYSLIQARGCMVIARVLDEAQQAEPIRQMLAAFSLVVPLEALCRGFLLAVAMLAGLVAVVIEAVLVDAFFWIVNRRM